MLTLKGLGSAVVATLLVTIGDEPKIATTHILIVVTVCVCVCVQFCLI